jgi:hypothetical protein
VGKLKPISTTLNLAVLVCLAAPPIILAMQRSEHPWTGQAWKTAVIWSLPGIFCAVYLRYEEKFRKSFSRKTPSHNWEVRMADLAWIVDNLPSIMNGRNRAAIEWNREKIRERILRCIVTGVADVLDLPPESLTANLVEFVDEEKKMMGISARSDTIRPVGTTYACSDVFLPWRAIKCNSLVVEDDFKERTETGHRKYKSIVAIPINRAGVAYGSLSIDCKVAYAFSGRKSTLAMQVRPYMAVLALTFPPGGIYHECSFEFAHVR